MVTAELVVPVEQEEQLVLPVLLVPLVPLVLLVHLELQEEILMIWLLQMK